MNKTLQTLTPSETQRMLNYLMPVNQGDILHRRGMRDLTMILLMLDAGLRVGEVVSLRISDLFLQGSAVTTLIIRSEITKTKTERAIPLSYRLQKSVEAFYKSYPNSLATYANAPAFGNARIMTAISVRQVERIVGVVALRAIGREINPHMLRHTFATRLMQKTNIRVVQELLGHSSIQSTQIYTHPNSTDLREAINAI